MKQCGSGCCDGPLAAHADGFRVWLVGHGYAATSVHHRLAQFGQLCRWLTDQGLAAGDLSEVHAGRLAAARRAKGLVTWNSAESSALPLRYLRDASVVPAEPVVAADGVCEELLARYRCYLVTERGLTIGAVAAYVRIARRFCSEVITGPDGLAGLDAGAVTRFVVAIGDHSSRPLVKKTVTALSSLLRYLHVAGVTGSRITVPTVAGQGPGLPLSAPSAAGLTRLLAGCDRRRDIGRRDYAVLMLLARLGLRAGEVAALGLDDIDWHHGEVVIHGKGNRHDRLPLPADVGQAIADYLRRVHRSAPAGCRAVFLRVPAPPGPLTPAAVNTVVLRAARRAGLPPFGPHRLRHHAATEMLRHGEPLSGIAQVLRHRNVRVTALYATADPAALRELARPWPGGAA